MSKIEQIHSSTENVSPAGQNIPPQTFPPCMYQCGSGVSQDSDEINLMDLWKVIWPKKWIIVGVSLLFGVAAAAYSLTLPNIYKAEVLLAPVGGEKGKGGLSAALGGLGGFASMAGISLPGGGSIEESLAVFKSREFLIKFVKDKDLMPILFSKDWDSANKRWKDKEKAPGDWDAYRLLNTQLIKVSQDKKSSLVTLSVEFFDPELVASWANELVARLNRYLREDAILKSQNNLKYLNEALTQTRVEDMRQTLFALISEEQKNAMLANTQEQFAFRVIDSAASPDRKSKPSRAQMVVLATLVGFFIGLFSVFLRHWSMQQRQPSTALYQSVGNE